MMDEAQLDRYLPASIRDHLEQQYYARVNAQGRLEHMLQDAEFLRDPANHIALYADHGVVHVRDVATQILRVLDTINGVLIAPRDESRLELMKAYGVTVAYLHDIGMTDLSSFGRAMHPEFVAQMVFDAAFDGVVETLWAANCAGIAARLVELADAGAVDRDPRIVLREMLAMASCHSKSKVPIEVLNDATRLGQTMRAMVSTELHILYRDYQPGPSQNVHVHTEALREAEAGEPASARSDEQSGRLHHAARRFYTDVQRDSFSWLSADHAATRELQGDVVDTLRALRCADALRQRGAVLKTSGSYEIFVDQMTGNAVFALRNGDEQLFLLATPDPIAGGEANLASSALGRDGNLHIAFHRGTFADEATTEYAAYCAGLVVNDLQLDVVESFRRPALPGDRDSGLKGDRDLLILLESIDDNLQFAVLVGERLELINPQLRHRIRVVPSSRQQSDLEAVRFLQAPACDWDIASRHSLLDKVARSGHNIRHIDPVEAFRHAKLVSLKAGDTLFEAGTAARFVYIPLGEGVKIIPLGGYRPFSVRAWMPLGITGVIRGASRNATVMTDRDITLLLIPKDVYLRQWHHPYSAAELAQRLAGQQ